MIIEESIASAEKVFFQGWFLVFRGMRAAGALLMAHAVHAPRDLDSCRFLESSSRLHATTSTCMMRVGRTPPMHSYA